MTCSHTGIVSCVQCTATFVCFQEIQVLWARGTSVSVQVLLRLSHFSVLRSNEHDFDCMVHCQ
jgi:hypothetical protein